MPGWQHYARSLINHYLIRPSNDLEKKLNAFMHVLQRRNFLAALLTNI